jgi:hypothetical protein
MLSRKVSKLSIAFILCISPDSAPNLVSRVLRDRHWSKSESELMFCRGGLFGVLVCCLYSMDEMLIHFSLVFDRWMTTPMPPSELSDGTVATGCTVPVSQPCSGTCCTVSATQGLPCTVVARTVSLGVNAAISTWTSWLTPPTRA